MPGCGISVSEGRQPFHGENGGNGYNGWIMCGNHWIRRGARALWVRAGGGGGIVDGLAHPRMGRAKGAGEMCALVNRYPHTLKAAKPPGTVRRLRPGATSGGEGGGFAGPHGLGTHARTHGTYIVRRSERAMGSVRWRRIQRWKRTPRLQRVAGSCWGANGLAPGGQQRCARGIGCELAPTCHAPRTCCQGAMVSMIF